MSEALPKIPAFLTFEQQEIEDGFQFFYANMLLNRARVGMGIMALLLSAMATLHVFTEDSGLFQPVAYLLLAIFLVMALFATFVESFDALRDKLFIATTLIVSISVVCLVDLTSQHKHVLIALQVVVLFWVWLLAGLRFFWAAGIGVGILLLHVILTLVSMSESSQNMDFMSMGIVTLSALFAALTAYFSERSARQTFALFKEAKNQQQITVNSSDDGSPGETQQEGDWATTLQELTIELSSIHDKDLMFNKLIAFMGNIIPNDASGVGLVKEQKLTAIVTSGALMGHQAEGIRNTLWDTQTFKDLGMNQNPQVKATNTGMVNGMLVRRNKNFAYRLDVPMYSQKRFVGAVTLLRQDQTFNEYEVKIAASCVFNAMMALKNARMQQKLASQSASQAEATNMGAGSVAPGPNTVPLSSAPLSHKLFREKANPLFDKVIEQGKGVSFLVVEIDQLKSIYEQMGEKIARNVYALVARSLRNAIGLDDLLGYYGKTGFAVMLIDKDILETQAIAKQVDEKLKSQKLRTAEGTVEVTLSMGISTFTEEAQDFMAILRSADMALFMVRETGGDGIRVNL